MSAHSAKKNLIKAAEAGYKKWIEAEGHHTNEPINIQSLKTEFKFQKFCFSSALLSYPYIETTLTIKNVNEDVGYYSLITTISGGAADDYFVLYDKNNKG